MNHLLSFLRAKRAKHENEHVQGRVLRERISQFAAYDGYEDYYSIVEDLWTNVRNNLSHTSKTFMHLNRNPEQDLKELEIIIVKMFHSFVRAWKFQEFYEGKEIIDIILNGE